MKNLNILIVVVLILFIVLIYIGMSAHNKNAKDISKKGYTVCPVISDFFITFFILL